MQQVFLKRRIGKIKVRDGRELHETEEEMKNSAKSGTEKISR